VRKGARQRLGPGRGEAFSKRHGRESKGSVASPAGKEGSLNMGTVIRKRVKVPEAGSPVQGLISQSLCRQITGRVEVTAGIEKDQLKADYE